jgi:hypothetical protein
MAALVEAVPLVNDPGCIAPERAGVIEAVKEEGANEEGANEEKVVIVEVIDAQVIVDLLEEVTIAPDEVSTQVPTPGKVISHCRTCDGSEHRHHERCCSKDQLNTSHKRYLLILDALRRRRAMAQTVLYR